MSLTPFQRTQSWNVEVVFEQSWRVFGFRQHGNNPLHISQIAHDFDLCFSTNKSGDDAASWQPAFLRTSNTDKILIVLDRQDNRVFPIPDAGSIHCYELVLHYDCARPGDQHSLEDDCIYHEREMMQRRFDPRYYGIGAKSTDHRLTSFPTRSSSQTRGFFETRTSSLKRDSTNSSPTRSPSPSRTDATCTDYATAISGPDARRTIAMFADSVSRSCPQGCVITGKGLILGSPGPSLEAAHLVPQSQWHTFPIHGNNGMADPNIPDQLQLAWNSTWNGEMNGSMMLSHIYKCFNARLFAIHPETHLIRVFVDYDIINEFHGKRANLPRLVPRAVLQLRWDLAVLENSPGMTFPFPSRFTNIPELPRPKARKLTHGDPSKEGSSTQSRNTQASNTQASKTQASGTQASGTQALPTSMHQFRAHPPSPPLSERASEGRTKGNLMDSDTVQQWMGEVEVLEDGVLEDELLEDKVPQKVDVEYSRGRSLERGPKRQRLEVSPGSLVTG